MVKVFTTDRDYTYEALTEQLNLAELDFRDGFYVNCASVPEKMTNQLHLIGLHYLDDSWRECKCNIEKHLPSILGLAKEGINQSKTESQKEMFKAIRNDALKYKRRLDEGQLTQEEVDGFSQWIKNATDEVSQINKEWGSCVINTSEYTDRISGLAGEAVGFAGDDVEKKFMADMRDNARSFTHRINSGKISPKEAEQIRDWSREMRRRVTKRIWKGDLPKTSRKDDTSHLSEKKKVKDVSGSDGEKCDSCTTVPDKYKNKVTGKKDWMMVTQDNGTKSKKLDSTSGNPDIMWIQR